MKKQIKPAIKAHLLRVAFYLLLLLATCAIPFALAQRNFATRSKTKASPASEFPITSNAAAAPAIAVSVIPPIPAAAGYHPLRSDEQPCAHATTPPSDGVITSQDYEPKFDNYDSFAADDFVIPAGQIWIIAEVHVMGESSEPPVPPDSFHVFFYTDSGTLPGTLVASRLANSYSGFNIFFITLTSPVSLGEGTYWVSVQAREDFTSSGEWFWGNRLVISNSGAAWQNPGGGFGANCPTWGRKTTCRPTQNGPDQLFRLVGTVIPIHPTPPQVHQRPGRVRRRRHARSSSPYWDTDGFHLIAVGNSPEDGKAIYNRAIAVLDEETRNV